MRITRKCILVIGMHRSGTSAVSGILNILGVNLGEELMPGDKSNEKGYFENMGIFRINERILKNLNSSWDDIREFPQNWQNSPAISADRNELCEFIRKEFSKSDIFAIKDPRIGLLLPIYLDILKKLNILPILILCKREEAEIIKSIIKRDGFSLRKTVKLIKKYEIEIGRNIKGIDNTTINYDSLIEDTYKISKIIAEKVGVGEDKVNSLKTRIEDFIHPKLKHQNLSRIDYLEEIAEEIEVKESIINEKKEETNRLNGEISALKVEKTSIEREVNSLQKETGELKIEKSSREKEVKELKGEVGVLKEDGKRLKGEIDVLKVDKSGREKEVNILREDGKRLKGEIDVLKVDKSGREKEVNILREEGKKLSENNLKLYKESLSVKEELGKTRDHSNNLQIIIKNIERSATFKILRSYQTFIDLIMPSQSIIRKYYDRLISANQRLINGEFGIGKMGQEDREVAENFWKNFHKKNTKTNILFINHEETRTGAPRIIFEIAKAIQKDYKISCVSKEEGSMHEEFAGNINNMVYPSKLYPLNSIEDRAERVIREINPGIVYVNSVAGYEYARRAKRLGIPTIIHVHELQQYFENTFNEKEMGKFNLCADVFIAVSNKVRDFLVKKMGCDEEKVIKINEFINADEIIKKSKERPDDIEKIKKMNLNKFKVFGLGTFSHRKGADIFIKAFKSLEKKYPGKFSFIWIGRDFEYIYESLDEETKGKDNLLILGERSNPFPYLKEADLFALPSREDPFPLVALEAMALGKPIIAFRDGGGSAEAIKDSGFIVDNIDAQKFSNKIEEIFIEKRNLRKLSEKVVSYQKKYDSTIIIPKIKDLLHKTLSEETKKVSIILTCYNQAEYIAEAIESIRRQTYKNWELIVADDASSDDSAEIVEKYIKEYPNKVKLIKKNENAGINNNYKSGVESASGEYLMFLEADDILMENSLEIRVNELNKNPDVILAYTNVKLFGKDDKTVSDKREEVKGITSGLDIKPNKPFKAYPYLKKYNIVLTFSTVIIRREAIKDIDYSDRFKAWFDWWFYSQMSMKGDFLYIPEELTMWRIHNTSYNAKYVSAIDIEKTLKECRGHIKDLENKK